MGDDHGSSGVWWEKSYISASRCRTGGKVIEESQTEAVIVKWLFEVPVRISTSEENSDA
jgi:hypothetical protein